MPHAGKFIITTVTLTKRQLATLDAAAKRSGMRRSEVVRRLVDGMETRVAKPDSFAEELRRGTEANVRRLTCKRCGGMKGDGLAIAMMRSQRGMKPCRCDL